MNRSRGLLIGGAVLVPLALAPLLFIQPILVIGLALAFGVCALASRSIVYPVALAGLPAVLIGLSGGTNPFPPGAVAIFGFAWISLAVGIAVIRNDRELPFRILLTPTFGCTLLLVVWLVVRLGPSLDPAYGSRKLQLFITGNLTLLVAGALIGQRRGRFDLYVLVALVMAILSSLTLIRALVSGQSGTIGGRFAITADDSPIGLGRDSARGLMLAVFVLLASSVPWMRVLAFAAIPLVAVALLASGSRGPIVGLVVGLAVLLLLAVQEPSARRRVLLVIGGVLLAVILVPQFVPGQDVGRALSIFSGTSEGVSSNGRSQLWSEAWALFSAHPLVGAGTGSFGFVEPVELFPHNFLLEAGAELGIVGVLLVGATVVSSASQLRRAWALSSGEDRSQATLVIALLAAAVTNASLSSDLTANEGLWLVAGLALGLGRRLDVPLLALDPLAMMRARRTPRGTRPLSTSTPPGALPARSPGRIVTPVSGETVAGVVRVEVIPAQMQRQIELLRLEWSEGSEWLVVAELDERAFELAVDTRTVAIVRSQRLAALVASPLDARVRRTRRAPWSPDKSYVIAWDVSARAPGLAGSLRAVTRDLSGTEMATPETELTIGDSLASTTALRTGAQSESIAARIRAPDELSERTQALRVQADVLDRRASEIDKREGAFAGREAQLEVADDEAGIRRAELAAETAVLAARSVEVTDRAAELDGRTVALAAREAELAEQRRKMSVRVDGLRDQERALETRERVLAEREAQLESAVRALDAREQSLAQSETSPPVPQARVQPVSLDQLELALARADNRLGTYRRQELRTLLFYLRERSNPDGTIPVDFAELVAREFGDLLDRP